MLLTNARLFDGERVLPDGHALLLEGERIAAIGPVASFDGFAGGRLDLAGSTVLPGLVDAHAHLTMAGDGAGLGAVERLSHAQLTLLALENAQKALAGGITALRDCGGIDFVELAVRDACNSGRFLGPTIRAAGQVICMTGGTKWRIGRVADGPDEMVKAVREQVRAGCDCIKLMATGAVLHPGTDVDEAQLSEEELSVGVNEARRFRRTCAAHAIGTRGILNAARAGVDSIEHGMMLDDECIELMLARRIVLVPTLAAIANVLRNADRGVAPAVLERAQRVEARHRASVKAYFEAGGPIAMGADTGTLFNPHGANANELRYMVDAGMTPIGALRSATAVGAGLLGLGTRGRLAADQIADLLVVRGDPTRDIGCAADRANHRLVLKDGRIVGGADAPRFRQT